MTMMYDGDKEWDEWLEVDNCEITCSFLKLVDAIARDIQYLKAETTRARYQPSMEIDPEHTRFTTVGFLSDLNIPHYDSLAYQEFSRSYYDGGGLMAFKEFIDSIVQFAKEIDEGRY